MRDKNIQRAELVALRILKEEYENKFNPLKIQLETF